MSDPLFTNAPGVSVTDNVWRQAVRGERLVRDMGHVLVLLWDLRKCYDHVDRQVLARAMRITCFLLLLARLDLESFTWVRVLTLDGMASSPILPHRGIATRATSATYMLKAFLAPLFRQYARWHPEVPLAAHVDDVMIESSGDSDAGDRGLVDASGAASDLAISFGNIGLPLSMGKLQCLATSRCLLENGTCRPSPSTSAQPWS